jgi:hypothetical protein
MSTRDDFIAWALSPDRTLEEAYCAERLVEQGRLYWPSSNPGRRPESSPQEQERKKKRRLNPAHRVQLEEAEVCCAVEKLLMMDRLDLDSESDRPMRDISGLRFFCHFRHLNLGGNALNDAGALRGWTTLESLSIRDDALEDLTPLAALTKLRSLHLSIRSPWPNLKGLEALEELAFFHWRGNLLSLEDIPRLGRVCQARFEMGPCGNIPVPSVNCLPEMPWLEAFEIDPLFRLDDITRWPRLRNLSVGGPFKDLRPLGGLRALTHLVLRGDVTRDLSPLARLPELRRLEVRSQHPHDYSVLAEAPRLHEVRAEGCKINRMELATLHAVLAPWEDEFLAAQARPRGNTRFVVCHQKELPSNPRKALSPEARWNDDPEMTASEGRWFNQRLQSALDGLLGKGGWGRLSPGWTGSATLSITRMEAAEQLAAIVETTRELLCATLLPWVVQFSVSLTEEEDSIGDTNDESDDEARTIQRAVKDRKEYLERQKEQEAYLEREHRLRLLQQEGKPVNPDEFAPPEQLQGHWAPEETGQGAEGGPESTVAEQLRTHGVITEEGLFIDERGRQAAEHLMGRQAERAAA